MTQMTTQAFLEFLHTYTQALETHKALLNTLDNRIGDGDHGTNMTRGFTSVMTTLENTPPVDVSQACQTTAMALLSSVGGASGPLYSTVFMRFMTQWKGLTAVDTPQLTAGIGAALEGLQARGKAQMGDKTMVDVWSPVASLMTARNGDLDWAKVAETARGAALGTRDMVAKRGRAAYLGERSRGTCDAGSISSAIFFETLAVTLRKGIEPTQWDKLAL